MQLCKLDVRRREIWIEVSYLLFFDLVGSCCPQGSDFLIFTETLVVFFVKLTLFHRFIYIRFK